MGCGNFSYDTAIADLDVSKFRDSYIKGIKGLLANNPSITIVCAILFMKDEYRDSIRQIASHYGLKCVDCTNSYYLSEQVHPTAVGMQQIENGFLTV